MSANSHPDRSNTERVFARVFTVVGGIFWIATAFAGPYAFQDATLMGAFSVAVYPLVFTAGMLIIGWFYERLAAGILAIGAIGTIGWGAIMGWEFSVWLIMLLFFVTPTVIAATLFYLAGDRPSGEPVESPSDEPAESATTRRSVAA